MKNTHKQDKGPLKTGDVLVNEDPTLENFKITKLWNPKGNHAWIYCAKPIKKRGPVVALKILKKKTPKEKENLQKEAKIEFCLNHLNIAQCYSNDIEKGEVKGKQYFFIRKEFIDGDDLRAKIKGKPMSLLKVLSFGIQIAQGLEHTKEQGIYHRDLKCENILITGNGIVKIIDFGQAARPKNKIDRSEENEETDEILGTIGSTPPEQYEGMPLDHRSDIWGLGVILYEMLARRSAFRGKIAKRVKDSFNKTPSSFDTLKVKMPSLLKDLIFQMLKKNPIDRPQSASDVRISLLAVQEHLEQEKLRHLKNKVYVKDYEPPESQTGKPKLRIMEGFKRMVKLTNRIKNLRGGRCYELRFCGAVDDWAFAKTIFKEGECRLDSRDFPSKSLRAWAIHKVTDAAADEDMNIWRTLRAASYISCQRRLLENTRTKNRGKIVRFFVTPRALTLRALAIVANQQYWGIDVFHVINSERSLFKNYEELLLVHCGEKAEIDIALQSHEVQARPQNDITAFFHAKPKKIQTRSAEPKAIQTGDNMRAHNVRAFAICWSEQDGKNSATNLLHKFRSLQKIIEPKIDSDKVKDIRRMDEMTIDRDLSKLRDQPWRYDGRAGSYLAFRVARSRIERATTIRAIDKTAMKRSLTLLRQNPGYLEWQEAQIRAIERQKTASLKRLFILGSDNEKEIKELSKVLWQYFRRLGHKNGSQLELPNRVQLAYTTELRIEKALVDIKSRLSFLQNTFTPLIELIKDRDHVYSMACIGGEDEDYDLVKQFKALYVRDFLFTKNMIYDYINPDADVDMVGPGDYLLFTDLDQRFYPLKALYEKIFAFVWNCKIKEYRQLKYLPEFDDD
jgi:serine/threonine protein kinase